MSLKKGIIISMMLIMVLGSFSLATAEEITVEDYEGHKVTLETPVRKIVCTTTSANQIIMALDSFDKVIAWDKNSQEDIFPRPEKSRKVVADSSHSPQIEAIAELDPDLVIADTMLQEAHRKKIESFDIPVIVERMSDSDRLLTTIKNIGKIVEKEERAQELISFINRYRKIIEKRTTDLSKEDKRKVYWEWYKPFKTGSSGASVHPKIMQAGGINICADAKGRYPTVSSEYVWESNPEVIVKQASRGASEAEMKEAFNKIIRRTSLSSTAAVQNEEVYVITWDITGGLPSIIGDLYFAKWIQPDLFKDINPEKVYGKLLQKFFGVKEFTSRVYPN